MAETEQKDHPHQDGGGGGASSDGEFETVVRKRHSNNSQKKLFHHQHHHHQNHRHHNEGPMNTNHMDQHQGGQGHPHSHNGGPVGRGRGRDRERDFRDRDRDRDRDFRERERDRDFRSHSRNNRNFRRFPFRESSNNGNQMPNKDVRNNNNKPGDASSQPQLNISTHTNTNTTDNMNQQVKDVPSCSSLKEKERSSSGGNGASSASTAAFSSSGAGDKSGEICCDSSSIAVVVQNDIVSDQQEKEKEKEIQPEIIITPAPPPQVNPWHVNRLVGSNNCDQQDKDKNKSPVEEKKPMIQPEQVTTPTLSPPRGNSRRMKNRASSGQSQHSQPEEKLQDKKPELEADVQPEVVVVTEVIITPAPLPQVNPWHVNKNAVSVIAKKPGPPTFTQPQQAAATDSLPNKKPASSIIQQQQAVDHGKLSTTTPTNNKTTTEVPRKVVVMKTTTAPPPPSVVAPAAKTQKTISTSPVISAPTTNNANQTANSTSSSSIHEQAKTGHNDANASPTLVPGEDITDGCLLRKEPPQGPKFRRGFAAVTKHHSNSNPPLSSTRNSPEDWPSLQAIVVTVVAPQNQHPHPLPLAQTKPVITLPPMMTGANNIRGGGESSSSSTAAATTPSSETFSSSSSSSTEDIILPGPLGLQKETCPVVPPPQLPCADNNWPSVSHHTIIQSTSNKESSLESGWHSGSDLTNEDTPSEASTGEIMHHNNNHNNNKDCLLDDGNSRNHSENGSLASSDDQGVVDNELETDADNASSSGGSKKGSKKSKQIKWVKLDLPETPSAKTRQRQERQINMEKEKERSNGTTTTNGVGNGSVEQNKGGGGTTTTNNKEEVADLSVQNQNNLKTNNNKSSMLTSNGNNNYTKDVVVANANKLSNGPTSQDVRSSYPPRGRGGRGGMRGRSGRGRFGAANQYWSYNRENNNNSSSATASEIIITPSHHAHNNNNTNNGEQEFPADYTTLPPLYPMTEFVMPYSTDPYYAAITPANYTPPQGTVSVVDDVAQLASGYVPVDATVLLDMVKKQIEYYFSEGNLEKDFYLRRKMDPEGFLPLNFIATFPRVKIMTQDPAVVIQAIQASSNLELTEDFIFVRTRNSPEKWPITNDHPSQQEGGMNGGELAPLSRPSALPLEGPTSTFTQNNYAKNTNGYDLLSGEDTTSSFSTKSNNPTLISPSGTNLNPNVAEFVPKSNINISLTV